ncbi:helix-turn-helix domain-containing protein [Dysgonomonas sp. Marseille-Q5470]|uniref:helix-turn-helix domain-containing protein n=1 Tax=Dysgonomonas sp. Marseille-Q5470 TaxID=3039494 RepID=UPI0024BBF388|nr:helix-turn-helix domain-containing protein [Dysgonomonas sp. Marseille-Q5470]MBS5979696.1 helix-turn-helix domain-containing protein [Dysgonomonas mossii]
MDKSLEKRVSDIEEQLFIHKSVFSFEEASIFLHLSKSYLYKLTSAGLIPHYKPQGKMLYFEKSELEEWLRQNPIKSKQEIEDLAATYVASPRKGRK